MSENISLAKTKHCALKLWDGRDAHPVYFQSRRDTSQESSSNCDADRTRPLSVNLMQPSGAIARKMLSKGFGNK
jgi:hypothetical protein